MEKDVEEEARRICIQSGFSCCDEVRYVSPLMALIDFPYYDACKDFMQATEGMLKVRGRSFRMQHSSYSSYGRPWDDGAGAGAGAEAESDPPSDTLMIRNIGEISQESILQAVKAVVPTVKGVKMGVDRHTRKPKGFCFVHFTSVFEAESAKNRILAAGAVIEGRKVIITFAKPATPELVLHAEMAYAREQKEIEDKAKQALGGINANMWASYMQFCTEEKEKDDLAKAQAAAQRELELAKQRLMQGKQEGGEAPAEGEESAASSPPAQEGLAPQSGMAVPSPGMTMPSHGPIPGQGGPGPMSMPMPMQSGMPMPMQSMPMPMQGGMNGGPGMMSGGMSMVMPNMGMGMGKGGKF